MYIYILKYFKRFLYFIVMVAYKKRETKHNTYSDAKRLHDGGFLRVCYLAIL